HPEVPQFSDAADRQWAAAPIDAFILARLKKEALNPSASADRATLIRRVYFDLTGLPPGPADVAAFLADRSPDAWEKLVEHLLATGFNRLGPLRKNAGNQEVASSRNEVLTEMTNIVGSALLGVTLGCARCHDHKFDPFRQSDYYRVQAYFAAAHDRDVPKFTPEEQAVWKTQAEPVEREMKQLRQAMKHAKDEERAEFEKKLE